MLDHHLGAFPIPEAITPGNGGVNGTVSLTDQGSATAIVCQHCVINSLFTASSTVCAGFLPDVPTGKPENVIGGLADGAPTKDKNTPRNRASELRRGNCALPSVFGEPVSGRALGDPRTDQIAIAQFRGQRRRNTCASFAACGCPAPLSLIRHLALSQ